MGWSGDHPLVSDSSLQQTTTRSEWNIGHSRNTHTTGHWKVEACSTLDIFVTAQCPVPSAWMF